MFLECQKRLKRERTEKGESIETGSYLFHFPFFK